jgi:protein arginine N-methyltransferase 1
MVSEGEKITGTLKCSPNLRNNRDLDITIEYILPDGTDKVAIEYKMCVVALFLFLVSDAT